MSFRYKEGIPVIEDLSLSVASGQTIAIVGHTGAGKTTLVNLLHAVLRCGPGRDPHRRLLTSAR